MGKEIIMFVDIEIEEHKFHCYENPNFLKDVGIDNILISNVKKVINSLLVT